MPTNVRPIGKNVLIRQNDPEKTSQGGIIIPDTAQTATNKGEVLATGPGWTTPNGVHVDNECRPGDVVYWSKYQGTIFEEGGEKYWLVREDDIMGRKEAA